MLLPPASQRGSIPSLMCISTTLTRVLGALFSPLVLAIAVVLVPTLATAGANSGTTEANQQASPLPSLRADEERGKRAVEATVQEKPALVILSGATVLTAAGASYSPGYIVLENGRIKALGEGAPPAIEGAHLIDTSGMFITPGIIDTHSHLGVYASPSSQAHGDGNEASAPTTPGVWAEHSFGPQDPGLQRAIAGGVTTIQVLPGSANLIGGRGVILQMTPHRGSRAMRFPGAPETLKMACGENPKRVYGGRGGAPSTRMGNLRATRSAFLAAERHLKKLSEHESKQSPPDAKRRKKPKKKQQEDTESGPDRDLDLESLVGVLRGEILPQVHCYRADDMLSMLQLADEFGFSIRSFHHATDAYKIRDILARKKVAASIWADWWGFKLEAYDAIPESAAMLAQAGGTPVIHSDSSIGIQRLNQEAAKAWYSGLHAGIELDRNEALRWITWNPAWALGIQDQTGSLEVGKRADVVVWDGDPFSIYTSARWVFVGGVLRYDSTDSRGWSDFELGQRGER